MRLKYLFVPALLLIALLIWWVQARLQPRLVSREAFSMGTLVSISAYTNEPQKTQIAIDQALQTLDQLHHRWHPAMRSGSGELGQINQAIARGKTKLILSPLTQELMRKAIRVSRKTLGYFNPAIGRLIHLWGFEKKEFEWQQKQYPPSPDQVSDLVARFPDMTQVKLKDAYLYINNPAIDFNFGAIAKGYALEIISTQLRAAGVENFLINAGGDIKVAGRHGEKNWQVGVRTPRLIDTLQAKNTPTDNNNVILAAISLNPDESIVTSGNYERFFRYQGKIYHHILNPFTGYPGQFITSVTVLHPDAAIADAAATAIFLAAGANAKKLIPTNTGQDTAIWQKIAHNLGIQDVMMITQKREIIISAHLRQRIQFLFDPGDYSIHAVAIP